MMNLSYAYRKKLNPAPLAAGQAQLQINLSLRQAAWRRGAQSLLARADEVIE
jgi:hypothetical protein